MRDVLKFLASLRLAVALLSVMALAVLVGTIVYGVTGAENGFRYVYSQTWFHLIFAAFAVNTAACLGYRILYKRKRWALGFTHFGLLVIMIGALVSVVWGQRGRLMMVDGDTVDQMMLDGDGSDDMADRASRMRPLGFSLTLDRFAIETHPDESVLVVTMADSKFTGQFPASQVLPWKLGWSKYSVTSARRVEHFERRADLVDDPSGARSVLLTIRGTGEGARPEAIVLTASDGDDEADKVDVPDAVSSDGRVGFRYRVLSAADERKPVAKAIVVPSKVAGAKANATKLGDLIEGIPVLRVYGVINAGELTRMTVRPGETWVDRASGARVRIARHLPNFRLNERNEPFSDGNDPNNPALELEITTKQGVARQWSFARPEFRSFTNRAREGIPFRFEFYHPAVSSEENVEQAEMGPHGSPHGEMGHGEMGPEGHSERAEISVTVAPRSDGRVLVQAYRVGDDSVPIVSVVTEPGRDVEMNDVASLVRVERVSAAARRVWREGETDNLRAPAAMEVEVTDGQRSEKAWIVERENPRLVPIMAGAVRVGATRREGMVKRYVSTVRVTEPGAAPSGPIDIEVNRPLRRDGWAFYQASYFTDRRSGSLVTVIEARRDPGVPWIFAGFAIVGAGMIWFYAKRVRREMERR